MYIVTRPDMSQSPIVSATPINSIVRSSPLASVKRESVLENDPLLDLSRDRSENEVVNNCNDSPITQRQIHGIDPIDILVDELIRTCPSRNSMSLANGHNIVNPLAELACCFKWNQVISMSSSLLSSGEEIVVGNITEERLSVLAYRFEAMFRLKFYDELSNELSDALSTEPLAKEGDCYSSLVLLQAEVKLITGRISEGLMILNDHISFLSSAACLRGRNFFWAWHSKSQLCNAHIRLRKWKTGVEMLRNLCIEVHSLELTCKEDKEIIDVKYAEALLLFRMSRLLLQIGAVRASVAHFDMATKVTASHPQLFSDRYLLLQSLLQQGLVSFSEENFEAAMGTFTTIIDTELLPFSTAPTQIVSMSSRSEPFYESATWILKRLLWSCPEDLPTACAVNNLAVCALYLKRNFAAMQRMEQLLMSNPLLYMTDAVVFNLCTMYDLSFSPELSSNKKKALQRIATRFQIQESALNWRSFRLS